MSNEPTDAICCMDCSKPVVWTGYRFRCGCVKKPPRITPEAMPALVQYMGKVEAALAAGKPVETIEVDL